MLGHDVTVFEARPRPGGLNEYGIAAYKTVDGFAQAEVEWLLRIGGIEIRHGQRLGREVTLDALRQGHDAVFLGIGLGGVNGLAIPGCELDGVRPAVDFIAELRQAADKSTLPVGRRVVVIGGGMTAIDAAVQARLLGAEEVTIVYRRGRERMSASRHEQEHAQTAGVRIVCDAVPLRFEGDGRVERAVFAYARDGAADPTFGDAGFGLAADQVFVAIGQTLATALAGLAVERGKIAVDEHGRTGLERVWAGGDCTGGGEDLTVTAVAQGRDAAMDIHQHLTAA
jgi:glutamate synthase (NADPH/NADH) small chain